MKINNLNKINQNNFCINNNNENKILDEYISESSKEYLKQKFKSQEDFIDNSNFKNEQINDFLDQIDKKRLLKINNDNLKNQQEELSKYNEELIKKIETKNNQFKKNSRINCFKNLIILGFSGNTIYSIYFTR